ncbi:hypothetical protein B0T18DRAFT_129268 [Schizothecium vesticola]|uniref:Uncharacterized protein n=1 Tax=Schizothecium vesticola TaxID=314040 RepID=A0AA40K986_9PEZI|nr:hypothetical protein B0T18DRAFT_129268 [Schizothecium vesticola]
MTIIVYSLDPALRADSVLHLFLFLDSASPMALEGPEAMFCFISIATKWGRRQLPRWDRSMPTCLENPGHRSESLGPCPRASAPKASGFYHRCPPKADRPRQNTGARSKSIFHQDPFLPIPANSPQPTNDTRIPGPQLERQRVNMAQTAAPWPLVQDAKSILFRAVREDRDRPLTARAARPWLTLSERAMTTRTPSITCFKLTSGGEMTRARERSPDQRRSLLSGPWGMAF